MIAFVFARGGSKGIPNKNLSMIDNKSLLKIAVEDAYSASGISEVIVSTDSFEIAEAARNCGASVPFMRPAHLATDQSGELESWRHAIQFVYERDGALPSPFISIPTTAPLRSNLDIENAIERYFSTESDLVLTVTPAQRSPYFNMVSVGQDGGVKLPMQLDSGFTRRQDAPNLYDIATVAYVANPIYVMECKSLLSGKVNHVVVPKERSIDIDDLYDLEIAREMYKKYKHQL